MPLRLFFFSPFKGDSLIATLAQIRIGGMLPEELTQIRRVWGWFLAFGIVQIIVGTLAIGFAFFATLASVMTLGVLLLVAGGAQIGAAILVRDWGGFFLFLLLGVLYAVAGFLTLQHPLLAAEGLTVMLAASFLVGGTFRVIFALTERFTSWGWVLANGLITILLGIAIWQQWPESGLWVLGLFIGVDLVANGVTWSVLSIDVRNGPAQSTSN